MGTQPPRPAERRASRAAVRGILVRSTVVSAAAIALYCTLPFDRDGSVWIWLVVGLVFLAVLIVWQTRETARSRYPRGQAIGALTMAFPLLLLLFAAAHFVLSAQDSANYTEALTRLDAVYFSVTTLATVGFGDIAPVSQPARIITTVQVVVNLVAVALVAQVLLGAVRLALRRRDGPSALDDDGPSPHRNGPPPA